MKKITVTMLAFAIGMLAAKADFNNQLQLPEFTTGKTVWAIKVGANFNRVSGSGTGVSKEMWDAEKKWGDEGWQ